MRTIERRLSKMEHTATQADVQPLVILLTDETGEPFAALRIGLPDLERMPDETAEAFEARAMAGE